MLLLFFTLLLLLLFFQGPVHAYAAIPGGKTSYLSELKAGKETALVALIVFMPTQPNGALGSLNYTKEERRALATKSREAAPKFGTPERQKLIDEIHEYMLSKAPPVPEVSTSQASEDQTTKKEDKDQENTTNTVADDGCGVL